MIQAKRLRALVVDDNAYARGMAGASLHKLGFGTIEEASGGARAVVLLLRGRYDLVLLDWYMPDINGAGIMQVLRDPRFGEASDVPVILMTAYASAANIARARDLGVNEVLVKPFSTEQLGAMLEQVLGGAAASAETSTVFV
ncbi:MAG TPA: response regulator [Devosia sp.]|nr:response regulator [Devosia sp.]